jgi:hypothetical protein
MTLIRMTLLILGWMLEDGGDPLGATENGANPDPDG